jgi:glyoxylase-like metal-dependent hydrolase (beta-lactamase superfamily II)
VVTRWRIGQVTVTKLVEREVTGGTRHLLPQATRGAARAIEWLRPHFADGDGRLRTSVHLLVVDAPDARVVVDTGLGNDKTLRLVPEWNRLSTPLLSDLTAAGVTLESVAAVVCTHLHVDHVGWNTRLIGTEWVPTFPNAEYIIARKEYDHWAAEYDERLDRPAYFHDSVEPVASQAHLVDGDHAVCDGVRLVPTPGHTPGHVSVLIESAGQRAIITGDALHHPIQVAHPDWSSPSDWDPLRAASTRHALLSEAVGVDALLIGSHFAGVTAGRVRPSADPDEAFTLVTEKETRT